MVGKKGSIVHGMPVWCALRWHARELETIPELDCGKFIELDCVSNILQSTVTKHICAKPKPRNEDSDVIAGPQSDLLMYIT